MASPGPNTWEGSVRTSSRLAKAATYMLDVLERDPELVAELERWALRNGMDNPTRTFRAAARLCSGGGSYAWQRGERIQAAKRGAVSSHRGGTSVGELEVEQRCDVCRLPADATEACSHGRHRWCCPEHRELEAAS
jgi:hypothetical protein